VKKEAINSMKDMIRDKDARDTREVSGGGVDLNHLVMLSLLGGKQQPDPGALWAVQQANQQQKYWHSSEKQQQQWFNSPPQQHPQPQQNQWMEANPRSGWSTQSNFQNTAPNPQAASPPKKKPLVDWDAKDVATALTAAGLGTYLPSMVKRNYGLGNILSAVDTLQELEKIGFVDADGNLIQDIHVKVLFRMIEQWKAPPSN
jgi:hypothetical protein